MEKNQTCDKNDEIYWNEMFGTSHKKKEVQSKTTGNSTMFHRSQAMDYTNIRQKVSNLIIAE